MTITLNRGTNGTGSNQTLSKTFGTPLTLPNSATANGYFTRAGYTVSAWSTTDGGAQTHTLAGSFTTEADTTLYPVWSANTLTVTFDAQGGSSVTSGSVATNAALAEPSAPTKTGYTLSGWSTTSSGSIVSFTGGYTHGQTANFTLFAIWSANALTITYDSKGGASVTSGTVNTAASISSAPTAPTRAGYTFSAWSATDGGTAITFPYAHGQTANFTLYALWTANSLTVTYDSKGGSSVTSGTVSTGASIASAPTAPTKTGYTLDGWSLTDGGTVVTFPFAHGQTTNFTLYAKWTGTTNTITYDSKGGSSVPRWKLCNWRKYFFCSNNSDSCWLHIVWLVINRWWIQLSLIHTHQLRHLELPCMQFGQGFRVLQHRQRLAGTQFIHLQQLEHVFGVFLVVLPMLKY